MEKVYVTGKQWKLCLTHIESGHNFLYIGGTYLHRLPPPLANAGTCRGRYPTIQKDAKPKVGNKKQQKNELNPFPSQEKNVQKLT